MKQSLSKFTKEPREELLKDITDAELQQTAIARAR